MSKWPLRTNGVEIVLPAWNRKRYRARHHTRTGDHSAFVQLGLLDLVRFPVATAATDTVSADRSAGRLRRVLSSGPFMTFGATRFAVPFRAVVNQFACELAFFTYQPFVSNVITKINWLPDLLS
jgi:hypothetical protein